MWTPQGLYAKFLLRRPTVFFGENAAYGLSNFPAARVAVLHGSALTEEDKQALCRIFRGREVSFLPRTWRGEPALDGLRETAAALESLGPDLILAVGGGSVIDGAKLCRVMVEFPYIPPARLRPDELPFKTRFAAIPTVAGSGAEASSAAVYIDRETGKKEMLVGHALQPEAVVFDPRYIRAVPEAKQLPLLADAVAHTVEGYLSAVDNPLAELLAEQALRLLAEQLSLPWEETDPLRLQYAAYLGGVVQNHCLVGAAHAAAHQLWADVSHGEAVAMLLPAAIRTNADDPAVRAKLDGLCLRAGLGGTEALLALLESIAARAGLTERRAALKQRLAALTADDAFFRGASEDRGGKGNPLPLDESYWTRFTENIC